MLVGFSTAAHAVTLRTPFVNAASPQRILCLVTNATDRDARVVSLAAYRMSGVPYALQTDLCERELDANATCGVLLAPGESGWCEAVVRGRATAAATVVDGNGATVVVVPAPR